LDTNTSAAHKVKKFDRRGEGACTNGAPGRGGRKREEKLLIELPSENVIEQTRSREHPGITWKARCYTAVH